MTATISQFIPQGKRHVALISENPIAYLQDFLNCQEENKAYTACALVAVNKLDFDLLFEYWLVKKASNPQLSDLVFLDISETNGIENKMTFSYIHYEGHEENECILTIYLR